MESLLFVFEAPKRKNVVGTKLSKPVTIFSRSNYQVSPTSQLLEAVKRAGSLGKTKDISLSLPQSIKKERLLLLRKLVYLTQGVGLNKGKLGMFSL